MRGIVSGQTDISSTLIYPLNRPTDSNYSLILPFIMSIDPINFVIYPLNRPTDHNNFLIYHLNWFIDY